MALTQASIGMLDTSAASGLPFRNRIINGDMRIDQRNAGASGTANNNYTLDRWEYYGAQASKGTWQQNAGSVTPPAGFTNYLGFTSSSAYTVGASESFQFTQHIEGYNIADLAWGTANAKSVTVSFWVRSSLTGTFSGVLNISGNTRAYPFTYIISSANTWEYKTIIIPGDTSGSWSTDNGRGISLRFCLGVGATYSATGNAWTGTSNIFGATGATSVVGTSGATWYVTGVQLEAGSQVTAFERRPYGMELQLCQRYLETAYPAGTPFGTSGVNGNIRLVGTTNYGGTIYSWIAMKVSKRATPSMTYYNISTGASGYFDGFTTGTPNTQVAITNNNTTNQIINLSWTNTTQNFVQGFFVADAEL